jgi:hypothetical protein
LAVAVVDAGVVINRNGGNFAYAVNSRLPYYPAPLQPFVNPYFTSFAPYPLINPVQVKSETEPENYENIDTMPMASPILYPANPYSYSVLDFGFGPSSLVQAGYEPFPVVVDEKEAEVVQNAEVAQVAESAGEVTAVEPEDAVVVQLE